MNLPCATAPHGLVGQSPQIREIRQLIEKIARTRSPVLLLGETGVGKEVVARAIHDANPAGNFVPIDCGSLVGPLMESELFGHTKGAFTGAAEPKKGLIELASGGTAFFDEIGDLPFEMQVKLLRVLQEREYRPIGSLVRYKVDLRVIAATHRDLAREVARGGFRQDLYYRLNVITLRIPPLRDHMEDLIPLIEHFLQRLGGRHSLTHECRAALLDYHWPGNVREVWNCLQRMTAMNTGPLLHVGDLPSPIRNHLQAAQAEQRTMVAAAGQPCVPEVPPPEVRTAPEASFQAAKLPANEPDRRSGEAHPIVPPAEPQVLPLAEVEKRAILDALQFTRGDRSMAAHLLGIGRTTLYRKLKEYQLEQ